MKNGYAMTATNGETHIYRVSFRDVPEGEGGRDFFFTSLAAIYTRFTVAQVGCAVTRLWNVGVSGGTPYDGRMCRITREPLYSKRQGK